ncbi:MAG: cysteine--tRNA ligase [Desulfohalobiaceae bacterium]|nr:cysteine--tRNA ligase [Desulfohalobiaceae bacterium]
MKFQNTLTGQKEPFVPHQEGKVKLYVCGITAYDYCHLGHARAAVVFDVLVRFLRFSGYEVLFIRNFTDVDDKIINRGKESNLSSQEVAERFIAAYYEDMERLGVLPADVEPRATEHIQVMQDLIQKLIDTGHAYATPAGDVYFRVRSFPDYGRLSGRNIEELKSGVRIEPGEDKEDPLDFALWKKAGPDVPSWPSPWGDGRPGWHIECSAMSEKYLGLPLDIHGGGQDLAFPHHENERAQSEAASGKTFVRYWLHNGFVRVNQEKMAKSLGNFITIRDIMQEYLPEVLRFFLLGKHYRSPLDFTWERLQESERGFKRLLETAWQTGQALENQKWSATDLPEEIDREFRTAAGLWRESLEDDLNTAAALGHLFSMNRLINRILDQKKWRKSQQAGEIFSAFLDELETLGRILGLPFADPERVLSSLRKSRADRKNIDPAEVEKLIAKRQKARQDKNFEQADLIRNRLVQMGVALRDTPSGPVWEVE